jgi:hypothetical protein
MRRLAIGGAAAGAVLLVLVVLAGNVGASSDVRPTPRSRPFPTD